LSIRRKDINTQNKYKKNNYKKTNTRTLQNNIIKYMYIMKRYTLYSKFVFPSNASLSKIIILQMEKNNGCFDLNMISKISSSKCIRR